MSYFNFSFRIFLCLVAATSISISFAQQNTTASQIQAGTQSNVPTSSTDVETPTNIKNIPELYPGETSDFGTQRLVREKQSRKWVQLNLDWQSSYTDNYLLSTLPSSLISGGKTETTQMTSTWDLAFAPDPFTVEGYKLSPKVGFRQTFFNYGIGTGQNSNFAAFDFDVQTIYGEVRADLGNGWSANLGGDWTRVTAWNSDSEVYRQVGPKWGVMKQISLNDYNVITLSLDQQMLFTEVATQTSLNLADNIYDHFDTSFGASYVWSPIDRLFVSPFYRMTYSYYPGYSVPNPIGVEGEDRSDFINTVGLTTTYQFNDYLSARVFVSYEKRVSTYSNPNDTSFTGIPNVPEYGKFDAGMGGAFIIRF